MCPSFLLPQILVYTPSKHLHQTREDTKRSWHHIYWSTNAKKMQVIKNVLNTPWRRQPMRTLPDPPQTTLQAN